MIKICQNYINHIQFKYMTLSYLQTRVPLRKGGPLSLVRDNIKHIYAYVCFIKKSVTADMLLICMTHIVLSGENTCKCVTEYTINNHLWVVSTAIFSSPSRYLYVFVFIFMNAIVTYDFMCIPILSLSLEIPLCLYHPSYEHYLYRCVLCISILPLSMLRIYSFMYWKSGTGYLWC